MPDNDRVLVPTTPEECGFPASPTAAQVNTWTRQQAFLTQYAELGGVYKAAEASACSVSTHDNYLRDDTWAYQKRYEAAKLKFLEKLETEADRRAVDGVDHPVIHQGIITDTYKQYSDNLLMFRMKRLEPAYRDNYNIVIELPNEFQAMMQALQQEAAARKAELPAADVVDGEVVVVEDKLPWE